MAQVTYEKSAQTDLEGGGKEFHEGSLDLWEDDAMQGEWAPPVFPFLVSQHKSSCSCAVR